MELNFYCGLCGFALVLGVPHICPEPDGDREFCEVCGEVLTDGRCVTHDPK
jgi:hypothetical protein